MVRLDLDNDEAMALLNLTNYFIVSSVDIEKIDDESKRKDIELEYYRVAFAMQNMKTEHLDALFKKIDGMRVELIKETEQASEAS